MNRDSLNRVLRTFVQSFLVLFLALATPVAAKLYDSVARGGDFVFDLDLWQNIVLAAGLSALIATGSFVHNLINDLAGSDKEPIK